MDSECVFCKIVAGELPATKIYEDDKVLAFLDIGPITKGHTLVIPRKHYTDICATPPDTLGEIMRAAQAVAAAQFAGLEAEGVNLTQANGSSAGQVVPHIHFHIIPRCGESRCERTRTPEKYNDQVEMESYAERIRKALPPR